LKPSGKCRLSIRHIFFFLFVWFFFLAFKVQIVVEISERSSILVCIYSTKLVVVPNVPLYHIMSSCLHYNYEGRNCCYILMPQMSQNQNSFISHQNMYEE
jgi:hypothetical protein